MPTKFTRVTIGTGAYVAMDATIKGTATVTLNNPSGVGLRLAGETTTTPAIGETVYALISSNSGGVYQFRCNPSQTWMLAASGGGSIELAINY